MKRFGSHRTAQLIRRVGLAGAGLLAFLLAAGLAQAQPANDNFASAQTLTGDFGSITADNTGATAEPGEPNHAGLKPRASIWYQWTASTDGAVEFDTYNSSIDTVLAVYVGGTLGTLNQVVANDDINTVNPVTVRRTGNNPYFVNPYLGPSGVKFNAARGTTYYIAVDGYRKNNSSLPGEGPIVLSWAYHPSGVFRFTADTYFCSETESDGAADGSSADSPAGMRITVTRLFGSSGKAVASFQLTDGAPVIDPITGNIIYNGATNGIDYNTPAQTNLVFDNEEMSKSFIIPIIDDSFFSPPMANRNPGRMGMCRYSRIFNIALTGVALDPLEDPTVLSPPRLEAAHSQAQITIYDMDMINVAYQGFNTNGDCSWSSNMQGTNGIVNFERTSYRVHRDAGMIRIPVYRVGGDPQKGASIHYIINSHLPPEDTGVNSFDLQAGSDYASPDFGTNRPNGPLSPDADYGSPVTHGENGGTTTTGYTIGAYQAEQDSKLTWSSPGDFWPKFIEIPILNTGQAQFNEDITITLFSWADESDALFPGNIDQTTVTILYDNYPAGALDDQHNPDFNQFTEPPFNTLPGADGTVYALAVQPGDKTIIAGHFNAFDATPRYGIARLNFDGQNDITFDPGTGVNTVGGDFISALALAPGGKILIGGSFNSFNGIPRYNIAQLNGDGSLDATFNSGLGANGSVWSVAVQQDGKVLLGGAFTSINGTARNYIARLNTDGSLDATFDPSTNAPNGTVNAVAVAPDGHILLGGAFTALGAAPFRSVARLNPDGSLDPTFQTGAGVDGPVYAIAIQPDAKPVIGGTFGSINQYNRRNIARLNADGSLDLTFDPARGADDSVYTVVVQPDGRILIGGLFTSINNTRRDGVARLFASGEVDTSFMDSAYNQFAGLHKPYYNPYVNPKNFLLAMGLQSDGNLMIGGSFGYVGGGRFTPQVETNSPTGNNGPIDGVAFTRAAYRSRANVARLLGGDTVGPGSMNLVATNYSALQSQSYLFVKLVRTNGTLGQIESTFSIPPRPQGPGVAQSGVDYAYNRVNPRYNWSWQGTRSRSDGLWSTNIYDLDVIPGDLGHIGDGLDDVYLTIFNKTSFQGDRTLPFQLDMPSYADVFFLGGENIPLASALGRTAGTMNILETYYPTPGSIGFSSPTYTVTKSGGNAVINLVRTNGSAGFVTVRFATTNGTAIAGSEYRGVTNTITFADGVTNATILVPIIDNSIIDSADKTVNLYLANPGNGAILGLSNAVLSIIDDNFLPGRLNFASTAYATNETAGLLTIPVTRTGGSLGVLDVSYATRDGSARSGINYVGVTNTFHWDSGDATVRYITLPLIHDGVVTPNLSFTLSLFNASVFGALGSRTNATITLFNQDFYGNPQFTTNQFLVNENGGYATITVFRASGSAESISVNYATSDGTAFSSGPLPNYVATSGTLTFGPGEVAKSFNVPILNDGVVDPNPFFFTVTLSSPSPAGVTNGFPSTAIVNIKDAQAVNEPAGMVDNGFNPNGGLNDDVYAVVLQPDGKIVAGGNFTVINGLPQNRLARINPDATTDAGFMTGLAGPNDSVRALVSQTDTRVVLGGTFTTMNSVNRNYIARLNYDGSLDTSFNPGSGADGPVYALAETFAPGRRLVVGGSFVIFNGVTRPGLVRLNDDGTVDPGFNTGIGVNGTVYAVAVYPTNTLHGGAVLIGGDFTSVNGVPLNRIARLNSDGSVDTAFNPPGGAGDVVSAIALQTDGRVLIGGAFTNVNGVAFNHLARLNDDGTVDPTFNVGAGANGPVYALALQQDNRIVVAGDFTRASGVTRNRITRLMPNGTVDPTINFGTGANGVVTTVAIQPDQKLVIGGGFTQVQGLPRAHLARLYGGSITGSGQLQFVSPDFQVAENGTNVVITVQRLGGTSGPNPDGSGDILVNFSTRDGTAVNGVNYRAVSATLDFPMGETEQSVTIPVLDDLQITPDLTANLVLSGPTAPAALGPQPTATLTIVNVDCAISFSAPTYSSREDAGVAVIHVVRTGGTVLTASVDFATTGGTAVPGFNYTPVTNTVTFVPGETDHVVAVPLFHTPQAEGNTTVTLELSNPTTALLLAPNQATLTIIDVDRLPGQIGFSAAAYTVGEGDTNAYITVLRTNGYSGFVSVSFATVPGTATPGLNYMATNGVLTFGDGETIKTFAVPILELNQYEGNVTLSLQLGSPTGGATLGGVNPVPLTILDNHVAIAFENPVYVVSETNRLLTLNVLRQNGTNGVNQVSYATTNGTALAGTNYVSASGTLTFNPGETRKTITLSILDDPRVTGSLAFGVALANPTAGAQLTTPAIANVVVLDVDSGLSLNTNSYTVLKTGSNVVVTVIRTNTSTGPVSVNYATADGTAVGGVDYVPTSGSLVFTNGQASNTFSVSILANNVVTGDKNFTVSLFNPTAPAQLLPPATATVTIVDNQSGFRLSSPSYGVTVNGVAATIAVQRVGYTNSTVAVSYTTQDGTAKAGADYVAVNGALVFNVGETLKTFSVPIIDTTVIGPDKTVLLKLFNPVGTATLQDPSAATLTIHNNNGSLIAPAGSALISETNANGSIDIPNGVIDPGETVTLLFAFRNTAGTNTGNMVATLLATNGITAPSGPQSYGTLLVGGPSASRPFTFTAKGANGQTITATFQLQDGATALGTAIFTYTLGTSSASFTSTNLITINDYAPATPYPATINVNGINGLVTKVTATLLNVSHTSPSDIDAVLVSPTGQGLLLMANTGGGNAIAGVNLTFDEAATNRLPQFGQIVSGTFQPTAYFPVTAFPPPAPPAPYATNLASFNGSNPNGNWLLYVIDDTPLDAGAVSNGWSLSFTTAQPVAGAADLGLTMLVAPNPVVATSNLTYTIAVTNYGPASASTVTVADPLPAGAAFVSAVGTQGTAATNAAGLLTWAVGTLAKDATATLTLIIQPTLSGTITNAATASAATMDLNPDDNSASTVVTVVPPTADLVLGLFDSPDPVLTGAALTYTISVTNLGPATATGVMVTNRLPAGVHFVSASPSQGTAGGAGGLVWSDLGTVGAGDQALVQIIVQPAVPGTLTDSASVVSDVVDPFKANNFATVKTLAEPTPLTVTQSGNQLTLTWPNLPGSVLETAASLAPPVVWTPVTTPPVINGGQQTVTLPLTGASGFYRFRVPAP